MSLLSRRSRVARPATPHVDAAVLAPPTREVSWQDAEAEVMPLLGPGGKSMLSWWREKRPSAVEPMQGFVHRRIFDVRPEQVEPLLNPPIERWPYPLGATKEGWRIKAVEDMTGGEPLVLAMHRFVETHGRVPSWPDVKAWMSEPHVLPTFVGPAWQMYHGLPEELRPSQKRWMKAITWRIGKAYLSFLREMDFLSRMIHRHGIPIRSHVVVDSVLKIDFWYGSSAVCLYIKNDYHERKVSPRLVSGHVYDIALSKRHKVWNEVARASDSDLENLADSIRGDNDGRLAA